MACAAWLNSETTMEQFFYPRMVLFLCSDHHPHSVNTVEDHLDLIMKIVFLTAALVAFVAAQQVRVAPNTSRTPLSQQATAQGVNPNQKKGDGAVYGPPQMFSVQFPGFQPVPQPKIVCDFESSVLILKESTSQGPYGQSQFLARRAKCADIAVHDTESCTSCCRMTARSRFPTVSTEKVEGLLVDNFEEDSEQEHPGNPSGGDRKDKVKRSVASSRGSSASNNVRCMCCGPRPAPVPQYPLSQFPLYGR
uniref:Secreted protein n=1 Tax=Steinernema glaseri TaxID=37863 RepID=A0A1I7XYY0_9BILA